MVKIVEVGPRDGLQNETATIPCENKVAFVNALPETGVGEIEVSAFVSPRKVPQLADAGFSMPVPGAWGAVPSRPAPPATQPPRTSSRPWSAKVSRWGSISSG